MINITINFFLMSYYILKYIYVLFIFEMQKYKINRILEYIIIN